MDAEKSQRVHAVGSSAASLACAREDGHAAAASSTPSSSPPIASAPPQPAPRSIEFELGNPTVEVITGHITLDGPPPPVRREEDHDDGDDAMEPIGSGCRSEDEEDATNADDQPEAENRHSTCLVLVVDVPAHLTLNELHDFLVDAAHLLHVQLVRLPSRDSTTDPTYAALLQFTTHTAASAFVREYDGVAYNSLEPGVCTTAFVRCVTFDESDKYAFPIPTASGVAVGLPHLTLGQAHSREDISPLADYRHISTHINSRASSISISSSGGINVHGLASDSTPLPLLPSVGLTPSHTPSFAAAADPSCPSCPVCLETLQPSTAAPMLTILCNHVYHFDCLSKWLPSSSSSSCPVCRYRLQPNVHTQCSTCKATEQLWLCILCGHVGCGRYARGHARQHFEETSHNYAIEVLTQKVWDYTSDCYVHRLVRNKADGKLVELSRVRTLDDELLPSHTGPASKSIGDAAMTTHAASRAISLAAAPSASSGGSSSSPSALLIPPSSSAYASVKLEEYLLEYNFLLSTQLDQQRRIFHASLRQSESGMAERRERLECDIADATRCQEEMTRKVTQARERYQSQTEQMNRLQEQHATLESQSSQLSALHAKLLSSSSSLRSSLQTSSQLYTAQQEAILRDQDTQISGVEDQLRDLAFFIDTQRKIDKMDLHSRLRGGPSAGLKQRLQSGKAELQLVEVAPDEEEAKARRRKKRG